jgi:Circadian oscillating protein COP23
MKPVSQGASLAIFSFFSVFTWGLVLPSIRNNSAQAQQADPLFSCKTVYNIPTTVYPTPHGEKEFISWDSNYFVPSGYTPEVRCQQVTGRLNRLFQSSSEQYITDGIINGQPVICLTDSEGGACKSLLYTLKKGQSGEKAIQLLIEQTESNFNKPPLREGSCHTYLNLNSFIEGQPKAQKICS